MELCRKGADKGLPGAQTDLSEMYLMGQGVARDPVESARLFRLAGEQGQANALLLLGQ
jgi:hypothetical protein